MGAKVSFFRELRSLGAQALGVSHWTFRRPVTFIGATAVGYYGYGEYGAGTSVVFGAAAAAPVVGVGVMAFAGTKALGNYIYKEHKLDRRVSFAKNPINDKFGTINSMRQFAGQQMRRDHSSVQRVLGNEAIYLHT